MILVYLENEGSVLPKSSLVTISAALNAKSVHEYSKVIGLLIGGSGTAVAADQASKYGLDEILFVESDLLTNYLAQNYLETIKKVLENQKPQLIMGLASSRGKDLFPRIAAVLDAGQASDVIGFTANHGFKRPMYAGNIIAEVEITTPKKVVTIRGSAFDVASESGTCAVNKISAEISPSTAVKFVAYDTLKSSRPDLGDAEIVVSGGRALKSKENFTQVIEPLADALGAGIGATRAAVDSGYAPNDWQVGQTGKIVAPKLYIAAGISGAIQHLAGMKDSKTIVAINTDPEAPIFEIADYGLVADLFQAVPELIEELKKS
jgi:electron transfer flavoprotein alpha subunit